MKNQKIVVRVLAGIMAAVMLLGFVAMLFPAG